MINMNTKTTNSFLSLVFEKCGKEECCYSRIWLDYCSISHHHQQRQTPAGNYKGSVPLALDSHFLFVAFNDHQNIMNHCCQRTKVFTSGDQLSGHGLRLVRTLATRSFDPSAVKKKNIENIRDNPRSSSSSTRMIEQKGKRVSSQLLIRVGWPGMFVGMFNWLLKFEFEYAIQFNWAFGYALNFMHRYKQQQLAFNRPFHLNWLFVWFIPLGIAFCFEHE